MNYKYELLLTKISELTDEQISLLLTDDEEKLSDYELTYCDTLTFKEFKQHLYGIINEYVISGEEGVSKYIKENLYINERIYLMDMFASIDYRFMCGKLNFKEFAEFNRQNYDFCTLIENSDPKETGYKIVKSNQRITMINYKCNNHTDLFNLLRQNGYKVKLGISLYNATLDEKNKVEFTEVFIYKNPTDVYLYCSVDVSRDKTNTYKEDVIKYLDSIVSEDMCFARFESNESFEEYYIEQACDYVEELFI